MIHRIHMGTKLADKPYVLGGFPVPSVANPGGTPIDFSATRFPGDPKACWACHEGTTYMLPLPAGLLPSRTQVLSCADPEPMDPTKYCATRKVDSEETLGPISTACVGCHNSPSAIGHAQSMTGSAHRESCTTCHGTGRTWDLQRYHQP